MKLSKIVIGDILVFFFLICWFLQPFIPKTHSVLVTGQGISFLVFGLFLSSCIKSVFKNHYLFFTAVILIMGFVLNTLYISGGYFTFCTLFGAIGTGYYVAVQPTKFKLFCFNSLFAIWTVYITILETIFKVPIEFLFPTVSPNVISTYSINLCGMIYLIEYRMGKRFSLWQSFCALYLSSFISSRTGFVVSFLLLALIVCSRIRLSKKKVIYASLATVMLVIGILAIFMHNPHFINDRIDDFYASREKVGNTLKGGLFASERWELWGEYISNLTPWEVFIGKNLPKYSAVHFNRLSGNLHNSFFFMHARSGIGVFSMALLLVCLITEPMLTNKKEKFLSCLLLITAIRAFFDLIFFFTISDFIFWAYIFAIMQSETKRNRFLEA